TDAAQLPVVRVHPRGVPNVGQRRSSSRSRSAVIAHRGTPVPGHDFCSHRPLGVCVVTNAIATTPTPSVGETLTRRRRRRRVYLVAGAAVMLVVGAIGWRYVKTGPAVHY